jgi:cell division protein FtsQ
MARRLKPGWVALGAVALAGALWAGLPRVLRGVAFFRVRRVEYAGLRYGSERALTRALGLVPGASVFDELEPMAERLRAVPGVADAQVSRRLPGTVRFTLRELDPVALAPARGRLGLIDSLGRVLPYDPATAAPDLPVAARADSVMARALARLRGLDPGLFAQVSTAARSGDHLVVEVAGRRWRLPVNPTAEGVRTLTAVAEELARQGRAYAELDGRFARQVVVRGLSS